MHSLKTCLLFVTALTFATPACFTIKTDDDDDSSGGSSARGGGSGTGGSTTSGGSSGTSGSNQGGTGGSSQGGTGGSSQGGTGGTSAGMPSCLASQLPLAFSCPSGSLSSFADSVCKPYWQCSFASICSDASLDCVDCAAYLQAYLTEDQICFTLDQKSTYEDSCRQALDDARAEGTYAQCQ